VAPPGARTVGKVFGSEADLDDEVRNVRQVTERVDPGAAFTPAMYGVCTLPAGARARSPPGARHSCRALGTGRVRQIVYQDGGQELWDLPMGAARAAAVLHGLRVALRGLASLAAQGLQHLDVKLANLVFSAADGVVRVIDFGLMLPAEAVFGPDAYFILRGSQSTYPPEFRLFMLIREAGWRVPAPEACVKRAAAVMDRTTRDILDRDVFGGRPDMAWRAQIRAYAGRLATLPHRDEAAWRAHFTRTALKSDAHAAGVVIAELAYEARSVGGLRGLALARTLTLLRRCVRADPELRPSAAWIARGYSRIAFRPARD
jgi:hypothetical protein